MTQISFNSRISHIIVVAKEDKAIFADGSGTSGLITVYSVELAIWSTRTSPGGMVCADLRNDVHINKRIQAQWRREVCENISV